MDRGCRIARPPGSTVDVWNSDGVRSVGPFKFDELGYFSLGAGNVKIFMRYFILENS
jgi:hypothetical protein